MYNPFVDIVALMPDIERPLTVADITKFASFLEKGKVTIARYGDVIESLKFLSDNGAIELREDGDLTYIKKKVYG